MKPEEGEELHVHLKTKTMLIVNIYFKGKKIKQTHMEVADSDLNQ